jgi:hypothetical protein
LPSFEPGKGPPIGVLSFLDRLSDRLSMKQPLHDAYGLLLSTFDCVGIDS